MSITCEELWAYGNTLASGTTEVEWRNAIGRCYYAAYHGADRWHSELPSSGVAPSGVGVHAALIGRLVAPTVTDERKLRSKAVGYMLRVMKKAREVADYDLSGAASRSDAAQIAADSRVLLDKIA